MGIDRRTWARCFSSGSMATGGGTSVPPASDRSRCSTIAAASTGAAAIASGAVPATVKSAAGPRSQRPMHGVRTHAAAPPRAGSPAGPRTRSRSAQTCSAPARRHARSSQTWATLDGRGVVENIW